MSQPTDLQSISMKVGELVGRVSEVAHSVNNMSQKLDALAMHAAETKGLPAEVAALDVRVTALETDRHRRDGAMGFGGWLLKMLPISAISAGISAAIAMLAGKHP